MVMSSTKKAILTSSLALSLFAMPAVLNPAAASADPSASSTLSNPPAAAAAAAGESKVSVYLDGGILETGTAPRLIDGAVLVPMRSLFEAQGAKLSWDGSTKTVTAEKGDDVLVYRIGERTADLNGQAVELAVPGQITDGYTLVPLRFVTEALGSKVSWDETARTVHVYSKIGANATVLWGVNLRSQPDSAADSLGHLIAKGEKVEVLREAGPFWLEVRTQDHRTGYMSAKPKYSDYTSTALREQQADELLAYGMTFLGTPYEFGAAPGQTATFDCSSFVKQVFGTMLDIDLPRVSYDQAKQGQEIGLDELQKGDLLFFGARGLNIGHVGIYAGNNQILHTYSVKYGVRLEEFSKSWKDTFVTARRIF